MALPTPVHQTPTSPRPEWQCLYKGTECLNVRTIKDDGAYHRFCPLHRSLAIRNQQRWHQRRRAKKLETIALPQPTKAPLFTVSDLTAEPLESLSDVDWAILAALLLDAPLSPPVASRSNVSSTDRTAQRRKRRLEQAARVFKPYCSV